MMASLNYVLLLALLSLWVSLIGPILAWQSSSSSNSDHRRRIGNHPRHAGILAPGSNTSDGKRRSHRHHHDGGYGGRGIGELAMTTRILDITTKQHQQQQQKYYGRRPSLLLVRHLTTAPPTTITTALQMGLMDSIADLFLERREGDFVKLDQSTQQYGPGPLLLLVNAPEGIDDAEIADILHDAAPVATAGAAGSGGCHIHRITCPITTPATMPSFDGPERGDAVVAEDEEDDDRRILDLPLQEALEEILSLASSNTDNNVDDDTTTAIIRPVDDESTIITPVGTTTDNMIMMSPAAPRPVLLMFSGFPRDAEMMAVYNVLGQEIYKETQGHGGTPACAKAVPNAMTKPLRQVVNEIAGDHQDAIQAEGEIDDDD